MKKIYFNSPVILWFVIACSVVLGLNYLTSGYSNSLLFEVYRSRPNNIFYYFRLFGHVLGHANFEHFANNMMYVLLAGPMVEEKYGSKRLLIMMLIVAFVTGLTQIIFFPGTALLGASGIVFMLIMMAATVGKDDRIPLTLIIMIIVYIGTQLIQGLIIRDNVSNITHIIGGVIGVIGGWRFSRE